MTMKGNLLSFPEPRKSAEVARLTPREEEVVSMAYLTNRDIAAQLRTSAHTIRAHFRSIAIKLGSESRTQAFAVWQQQTRRVA